MMICRKLFCSRLDKEELCFVFWHTSLYGVYLALFFALTAVVGSTDALRSFGRSVSETVKDVCDHVSTCLCVRQNVITHTPLIGGSYCAERDIPRSSSSDDSFWTLL